VNEEERLKSDFEKKNEILNFFEMLGGFPNDSQDRIILMIKSKIKIRNTAIPVIFPLFLS
jgi:hypothetical protein